MSRKLSFVGEELSFDAEAEIVRRNGLGLNAEIEFTDGKMERFNNLTEVHWRYKSMTGEPRVALESHIHGTGYTYDVKTVKSLSVDTANAVSDQI